MPIDPKVREAFEQRGPTSVRGLLKQTGTSRNASITLGPGFWANRSDAEEWLREKDRSKHRLAIIAVIIAAVTAVFGYLAIPPRHVEPVVPQSAPAPLHLVPGTNFQPR